MDEAARILELEPLLKRTLAQLQPLTWERKVRRVIEAQLPDGEPSAERVAQALHLSLRSLQRHLADEGCRFDALLNECRENLALLHLRDPQCSLAEIMVYWILPMAGEVLCQAAWAKWKEGEATLAPSLDLVGKI